jgi:hypothetical protein
MAQRARLGRRSELKQMLEILLAARTSERFIGRYRIGPVRK